MYDSRDVIYNASRGIYARLDQRFYPSFFGNKGAFTQTELIFRRIPQTVERGGDGLRFLRSVGYRQRAWTMLARLGGSYRMRGYYEGALPRPADGRGTGRAATAYLQPSRCGGMGRGRQCIPDFRRVQSGTHCPTMAWDTVGSSKIKSTSGSTTGSVKARTASCSVSTRHFDAQPVASGVVRAGVFVQRVPAGWSGQSV